jgi:hypothetical protein
LIEKVFPNTKILEITNPVKLPGHEQENEHNRNTSYMSDTLLSNISLQLPSITKFCLLLSSQPDDYKMFRRFLHLLPSVVSLQMYIGRSLFRDVLAYEHEDDLVKNALARIKLLQMVRFYDEKNVLSDEEIHCLFPNAQILFDYDNL